MCFGGDLIVLTGREDGDGLWIFLRFAAFQSRVEGR